MEMEPGSLIVFFGLAAAVIATGIYISISTTRAMNGAFREAARRLGASFQEGGLFDEPAVGFTLSGCPAWIKVGRRERSSSAYTRVVVRVRNRTSGKFTVAPVDLPSAFLRRYGPPYVNIGDPDFDRDYAVESVPPGIAAQVFAPSRRGQAIATIRRLEGLKHPWIKLDDEHLVVQVLEYDADPDLLMRLVKTAEEMIGHFLESAPLPGIRLGEVRLESCGECQVCGSPLEEAIVRCDMCRTPHHSECWQYMGRCSTYACKGRRYVA